MSARRGTDHGASRGGLLHSCRAVIFCSLSAAGLSGCVDAAVEMGGPQAAVAATRGATDSAPQNSPRGASLAVLGIEGPPDEVNARFQERFASAAQGRDVTLAEARQAHYRLRGFLTASPAQGATRLAYVLDIYDRQGRRVRRLTSEAGVKADADPWRAVDEKSLSIFAERGASEVAAYLASTPEAIAALGGEGGVSVVAGEREKGDAPAPNAFAAVADKH